jgi:hypothetical protein
MGNLFTSDPSSASKTTSFNAESGAAYVVPATSSSHEHVATLDVIPRPRSTHAAPARKIPRPGSRRDRHTNSTFFSDDRTRTHTTLFWSMDVVATAPRASTAQYADDVPIHVFFAIDANPLHSPDPVNGSIVFASHTHRLVPPPPCLASNSPPVDANRLARVAAASLAETTTRPHPGGVTREINTTFNDVVPEVESSLHARVYFHTEPSIMPSANASSSVVIAHALATPLAPTASVHRRAFPRAKSATASPSSAGAHPPTTSVERERASACASKSSSAPRRNRSSSTSSSWMKDARTRARSDEE